MRAFRGKNGKLIPPLIFENSATAAVASLSHVRRRREKREITTTAAVSRVAEIGTNYEGEILRSRFPSLRSHQHVKPLVTWTVVGWTASFGFVSTLLGIPSGTPLLFHSLPPVMFACETARARRVAADRHDVFVSVLN